MTDSKPMIYYLWAFFLIALGLTFAIFLTYNHYLVSLGESPALNFLCSINSYFDCAKVSLGRFSSFFGIPIALWGVGFYLITILYFLFPLMNEKGENYLKVPFFFLLSLANIINLGLFFISVVIVKALCTQCITIYIATLGLLLLVYYYDFKGKKFSDDLRQFFSSLFKKELYQKELVIYTVISLLLFSLLFFFYKNKRIISYQAAVTRISLENMEKYRNNSVNSINSDNNPYLGNKNGELHLIVFQDLQCGHCQHFFYEVRELVKEYSPAIKVSYLNFPFLRSGRSQLTSFQLAQYSLVANQYGKYFQFLDALFQQFKVKYIDKNEIEAIFQSIGIQKTISELDQDTYAYTEKLNQQKNFAHQQLNIGGTPAVFLNGKEIPGFFLSKKSSLIKLIEKELIKLILDKQKNKGNK